MRIQIISMNCLEWDEGCRKPDVLPFYSSSFERLNRGQEYECGYGYNSEVREKICTALNTVCKNVVPDYYYDLRNWEEFSCAAPQYMILDAMKWNKTKPLAFLMKSQADLYLVLEQFIICARENETAAITMIENNAGKSSIFSMFIAKSN